MNTCGCSTGWSHSWLVTHMPGSSHRSLRPKRELYRGSGWCTGSEERCRATHGAIRRRRRRPRAGAGAHCHVPALARRPRRSPPPCPLLTTPRAHGRPSEEREAGGGHGNTGGRERMATRNVLARPARALRPPHPPPPVVRPALTRPSHTPLRVYLTPVVTVRGRSRYLRRVPPRGAVGNGAHSPPSHPPPPPALPPPPLSLDVALTACRYTCSCSRRAAA